MQKINIKLIELSAYLSKSDLNFQNKKTFHIYLSTWILGTTCMSLFIVIKQITNVGFF